MNKTKLLHGIFEIGEYIYEVSDVGVDDETDESNAHIKYMYEVLDALEEFISKD